jgi:hypothetical protein
MLLQFSLVSTPFIINLIDIYEHYFMNGALCHHMPSQNRSTALPLPLLLQGLRAYGLRST